MSSYDPNNVFAKILRGEFSAYKVYEDDRTLAFLDIMPQAPGHTLVVPKSAARNILDVDPDDLAYLIKIAQKIATTTKSVFAADGVNVFQFNEPAAGQTVFHLHFHIIPRKDGVPLKPPASIKEDASVLAEQQTRLAAALKRN